MNLRNHLVDVVAEFFYAGLFDGGNEDAGRLFLGNPAVPEFFEGPVFRSFGLQGIFVVFFVCVVVYLIEYHIHRFVGGPDVPERFFHDGHLFLEIGVGNIDDMDEDIRLPNFVQRAFEGFDELGRKFPDESDRVAEEEGNILDHDFADGGIQGGE